MNDIDRLLQEAGDRWRASQPASSSIDLVSLLDRGGPARQLGWTVVGLAGLAIVLVVGAVALQLGAWRGVGGNATGDPSDRQACDVTRPDPPFVAPRPYLASPPEYYGSEWFGSDALWTMLHRDGEVWSGLPHGSDGVSQKTFWWSVDWPPDAEPEPAITVVGTRLDGSGVFSFGPGTNASADFGTAMLVGIEIPTSGCWQITGRYRDAELSYVVWVEGE